MLFEEQCKYGIVADNKQTFEKYAQYVLELKQRTGVKHRTIVRYKELLERINPAIGHFKLADLTTDTDLLELARNYAFEFCENNDIDDFPHLKSQVESFNLFRG